MSHVLGWIRSSLMGHILLFGLGAGGVAATAFIIMIRTEGPLSLYLILINYVLWIVLMAPVGVLFWYTVTLPARTRNKS